MSSTEIAGLTKNKAYEIGETRNGHRGAMAVWQIVEKRYLPSLDKPYYVKEDYSSRVVASMCSFGDEKQPIDEIWGLVNNIDICDTDRIVLASTFDNVLVKKEYIPVLLKAFREFEGETSLKEQADIIERAVNSDKSIVAIGWNQTSVNENKWLTQDYNEKKDEYLTYNLKKNDEHWYLFEDYKYCK